MFKKFKDKLAEEMKQSPARLQASMQQLAQAVVSPALSNSSVQELSASNDNFSLTEEGDETPKNSPVKHGFQNVDLISPISNSIGISRRSSISSITSDTSSLFPIYESPANLYHLQSDMDQSASEIDENINSQLDKVTKDQIYSAYRKVQAKYHKYRGRYTDLATHYKELERIKSKLESVLVETQDKVLRRIADLKEQCQLEQQAKAHLEEALRNDIEEKDHIINTLNTKIKLLQTTGPNLEALSDTDHKTNLKDNLIDLSTGSSISDDPVNTLLVENTQLKDKLKKLENVVLKYKESLKRNKEKFTEVLTEKNTLESDYETLKISYAEKNKELNYACTEIKNLTDQMAILKKREEESVISLAENKLSIHRELEDKEEQIKKLQLDLKHMTESKEDLTEIINKYKLELEKLKLSYNIQNSDSEKKEIIQDISNGKSETLKSVEQEMQQKLINLEEKMGLKYHEEDCNKENLEKSTKVYETEICQNLKSKLDEKEIELQEMKNKLEELQKLNKKYQMDKEDLYIEFSNHKLKCTELQNEQDAQRIIAEEKTKEAETTIEKLQATIQSLDKELENMRNALIDRDKVCENYNAKIHEYTTMLEKMKEKLLIQEAEMKILKEKIQDNTEIIKLNYELENKNTELLGIYKELQSCKSTISDLNNRLQTNSSNIDLLYEEKNNLIRNILNYKIFAKKLKEDNMYIKNNAMKYFTEINNEISILKSEFDVFLKTNNIVQNNIDFQIKLKEFEELKQKYDQLQAELKDTICLKSNLEINLEKYNKQLNDMSIKMAQQCEIDLKNRKLIAEIDNLNFKLYDLRNLPEQLKLLMIESKSLQEELNNVNSMNQLLSNEIYDLKNQLEEANNTVKKLEELEQKYIETTKTVTLLKSENSNCNKLEEKINTLQLEIKVLHENLLEKEVKINTLNEELENKESCLINLRIKDENHVKLIEKHEKDIIELTNSNKTIQNKVCQLKKLKTIKQQQDITIQNLNDEINEIKTLNIKLLEQIKTSENEMNMLKSENCQIEILRNNNATINFELEQLKLIQNEMNLENKNLKDKQNEFLKYNQELSESNEKLKEKITNYEKYNQQLQNENKQLQKEIESHKISLSEQKQHIENLKNQIVLLNSELQCNSEKLNFQIKELTSHKKKIEETKEYLTKENENLHNEIYKLNLALKNNNEIEEKNKELLMKLEFLNKEVKRLKVVEEEINNLNLEINNLNIVKANLEEIQSQNNELIIENLSLKNKTTELENVNTKLQSYVNNLESKVSNLNQIECENNELKSKLDTLKTTNKELLFEIKNENIEKKQLTKEIDELKVTVDEKVAELKLLDTKNMELLKEIERLKFSTTEEETIAETKKSTITVKHLKETITELQNEIKVLRESNIGLNNEIKNINSNKVVDDFSIQKNDKLEEENKKLEAQLDEALITFQAKELEMQFISNELKNQVDNLKQELKINEEEQSMRLKQLVKEFQAQLHDKEEELHAALEKRFDRQQNYESNLIQQYKEQLKDFQIELTAKSEQIENLILENKNLMSQKAKDINQLMEKITIMKKDHTDEIKEIEKKWKSVIQQKTNILEAKHEEEINELTREWRNERRPDIQTDLVDKELESTSRVAMAAVQSNTGSFHTLQQTLTAQRRELTELRKLMKLRHDTLEDSTEIEYLRNILFEYMMGRETMVLARVIAAVVKFDQEQTAKILKKEEDKMTLLGSLGLT